jgi:hypothetical protein
MAALSRRSNRSKRLGKYQGLNAYTPFETVEMTTLTVADLCGYFFPIK